MKVLVTGATGFVGKRLVIALAFQKHRVVAIVRSKNKLLLPESLASFVEVIECDLLQKQDYAKLPTDIDVAFFLVHSMSYSAKKFDKLEEQIAKDFVYYTNQTKAKQILFLSGIMQKTEKSKHMQSRKNVENILQKGKVPLTILRAAIILGEESPSFQILYKLTEKIPFMVAPKWIRQFCQPIHINEVIAYLTLSMNHPETFGKTFDIFGPTIISFKNLMLELAKIRGLSRYILTVKVLTPTLSSYWLKLVTRSSYHLGKSLIESIKQNFIAKNQTITSLFPIKRLSIEASLKLCLDPIQSLSSLPFSSKDFLSFYEPPHKSCYSCSISPRKNLMESGFFILLQTEEKTIFYKKHRFGEIWMEKNTLFFRPLGLLGRSFWPFLSLFWKSTL